MLTIRTVFIKKPEYESIVPLFFLHRYHHRQRPFLSLAVFLSCRSVCAVHFH
ncbi:hypothetical protein EC100869_1751, partial [Escherichia coli 10.0869]